MKKSQASEAGRLLASLRETKLLTCPSCGEMFEGIGRRVYCSKRCRQAAYVDTHREQERERQRLAQARRRKLLTFERRSTAQRGEWQD